MYEKLIEQYPSQKSIEMVTEETVTRITTEEAQSLRVGDVVLVNSENVAALGDHFIVVTGPPVEKPHGIRPETTVLPLMAESALLRKYKPYNGVIALKLKPRTRREFLEANNIYIRNGVVLFPDAILN